jgi:hypothetical protein
MPKPDKNAQSDALLSLLIKELAKEIRLIGLTLEPLRADLRLAIDQWRGDKKSQFWSRTVIRCICALTEASLFSVRAMALRSTELTGEKLEPEEVEILTEKRVVKVNGVETTRPKFLPFPEAVKETFRLFAKASGVDARIEYTKGFEDLCATFQMRNRLMHPKGPFDLEIREANIETADRGICWLINQQAQFFNQVNAQMDEKVAQIRRSRG